MKKSYLLFILVFTTFIACQKTENVSKHSGGNKEGKIEMNQAIFLNPQKVNHKASDTRIMDTLIRYLKHTPKGAKVYISMYVFTYKPVLRAIGNAYRRGVEIHLLLDSNSTNKETIATFNLKYQIDLVTVTNDIDPPRAINHEKYILFSKIDLPEGIAKYVVFNTSHNFTLGQTKKVQDAVIITNKELYNFFLGNWKNIASRAKSGMKSFSYSIKKVGDSIHAYFLPRLENGVWDGQFTALNILNGLGKDYSSDTICIFMDLFSILPIINKLIDIQINGGHVEIIEGHEINSQMQIKLGILKKQGGYVNVLNTDQARIHSKVMLIKGKWNGKQSTIVLSGSLNFNYYSEEHNINADLMLIDSHLFKGYYEYFKSLKRYL